MPSKNNFQEIYKKLEKPLSLAGYESANDGEGVQDKEALRLFDLIYDAQNLAAELGWGDDLEWGEVLDDMIVE